MREKQEVEVWPEIQYNTISFIEDDKNKGREVSADTAATETYYMMGINKNIFYSLQLNIKRLRIQLYFQQ